MVDTKEKHVGLDLDMTYREHTCENCGHTRLVLGNVSEVHCPACKHGMTDGGEGYCTCSHKQKMHTRPEEAGCWECGCVTFQRATDYVPDEYDAQLFKIKTCKHEWDQGIPDKSGKVWWTCIHCGAKCNVDPKH